jgi:serine/threonine-protein kinase
MVTLAETGSPVREGDLVGGKYLVERVLGVGGMGVVVAATHTGLHQRVALKFLLPQAALKPDVVGRFAREARAAARLHSEHVAKVLDVGELEAGSPFMVMEYMDGEDLDQLVRRSGPLPVDVTTAYVLEACEAVAEAHSMGIVHRDLKPANLFLARRPDGPPIVKVLDFGISKSTLGASQAHMTKTSSVMGSPLYMSPEQMASAKTVDLRSDIWALGVVLYELLAGRPPFVAETMPELVLAIVHGEHVPVAKLRADVPAGLDAAIERCLTKAPAQRFATIRELAEAIAPYAPARSAISVERVSHVLRQTMDASAPRMEPLSGPSRVSGPSGVGMTHAQWSQATVSAATLVDAPRRPLRAGLIVGAAMACAVTVGVALRVTTGASVTPSPALASVTASPSLVSASPPVQTAAAADPPGAAAPPTGVPATPSATAPPPAASASAAPHPTKHPGGVGAAAAKPKCEVLGFPDSDGNMRFKQVCH